MVSLFTLIYFVSKLILIAFDLIKKTKGTYANSLSICLVCSYCLYLCLILTHIYWSSLLNKKEIIWTNYQQIFNCRLKNGLTGFSSNKKNSQRNKGVAYKRILCVETIPLFKVMIGSIAYLEYLNKKVRIEKEKNKKSRR